MRWNVVATVYDGEFDEAIRLLEPFGEVARTNYWNVLAMRVADIDEFMTAIERSSSRDASIANSVSRILPVTETFDFQTPEEFERRACHAVERWLPELEGKRFHVRMHRRGFKGRISSQHEEQFLDHHLIRCLEARGSCGQISFDDPDAIIVVETIDQTAGLSYWTRERIRAFGLCRLD